MRPFPRAKLLKEVSRSVFIIWRRDERNQGCPDNVVKTQKCQMEGRSISLDQGQISIRNGLRQLTSSIILALAVLSDIAP